MDSLVKEGSIGSVLFKSRIISEEDIQQALSEQQTSGCRFGEALIRLGIVTQEDIDWALSNQLNIPYVRLKKEHIDPAAVAAVPAELARRGNIIPIIRIGDELRIAMADPLNRSAIEEVEQASGCSVSVSVGLIREIREMLDVLYGAQPEKESLGFNSDSFSPDVLDSINADLSGGKLLDHLLLVMLRRNLSALSLQPAGETVKIIVRRGGKSREAGRMPAKRYPDLVSRIRTMSGVGSFSDTSAQGRLGFRSKQQYVQFQVLILRTMEGDYVTFKLDLSRTFPDTMEGLGLSPSQCRAFRELLSASGGLILFAMREGTERCRLLDLFLDLLDTANKTVILLGDGLGGGQKRFPRLPFSDNACHDVSSQIQAIVEHEPDIVAIEDMYDGNAFMAAGRAALRGKLVIAGVPWHGTGETVKHLLSFQHRNHFLVNTIRGLITCTGVLTLCPHCRTEIEALPDEAALLPSAMGAFFRASGCEACDHTGQQGKKYLAEVHAFDRTVHETFASAQDSSALVEHFAQQGELSVRQQGEKLLRAGEISPEEFISSLIL